MSVKNRLDKLERPAKDAQRCPLVIFTNDGVMEADDKAAEAQAEADGRNVVVINITERKAGASYGS